jgi:tetratricopeptide (TPR) repeat protein
MRVIRAAQAQLKSLPCCIVIAFRPSASSHELTFLVERLVSEGAVELSLDPLGAEDVVRFLSTSLAGEPGPRLLDLGMGTEGSPFLLTELMSEVRSVVEPGPGPGQIDVPDGTLPRGLRRALERRIDALSEEARSLLRVAALLGNSFEASDLTTLAHRPAAGFLDASAELLKTGLLAEQDQGLCFRHDLIREQVLEGIPRPVQAALHRNIARSLVAVNSSAFQIAHHYALAGPAVSEEAAEWLARAARNAAFRDPQTAIGLLRRTLQALSDSDRRRQGIEAELAVLLAYSGRPDEAESLARAVLALPDGASYQDSLQPALVQALFAGGRWRDVVSEVERARDVGQVSERSLGRLLAESALARIWLGDVAGAEADANEALAIGKGTGDAVTTCFALGHLSTIAGRKAMLAEGVALAQQAVEVAEGLAEADRRHPHIALGAALIDADRPEDAKAAFRAGQRLGERAGTVWDLPVYHAFLAIAMYQLGEWDDAIAECEVALSLSEETGVGLARVQALGLLAAIALQRGDESAAKSWIASADLIIEQSGPQWGTPWMVDARAEIEASEGKAELACSRLREVWQQGAVPSLQGPGMMRLALRFKDERLISMIKKRLDAQPDRPAAPHPEQVVLL